jgi:pyruvate dehydrogenase phosphatase
MLAAVMDYFKSCWGLRSRSGHRGKGSDVACRQDGLLWHKDAGQLVTGDFSMAVVQANQLLEDHSQVESGPLSLAEPGPQGTFVGVYDGHGGPETSRFINDHLFNHLRSKSLDFPVSSLFQGTNCDDAMTRY